MKKIVSALVMTALAIGSVFAADISMEYTTGGYVYSEEKIKDGDGKTTSSTKTVLDQAGYSGASSDVVLKASSDVGGFVLDIDPDADSKSEALDEWYAWVNFANIQVTVGKWAGRYVNRVKQDMGNWDNPDYERYKPGVVGGIYAEDSDNLTKNVAQGTNKLATAIAYTVRPNDDTAIMFKGVLVNAQPKGATTGDSWGGAFMDKDSGNYTNVFFSGFAGEVAAKINGVVDVNAAFRSEKRDALSAALFIRPLMMEKVNLMVGFSGGMDLHDYGETVDRNYMEGGMDIRARIKLSDNLALTTMNNVSGFVAADDKSASTTERTLRSYKMWNMVSLAYNLSEQTLLQCTLHNEMGIFAKAYTGGKYVEYSVGDLGGINLSIIPGVTYSFNENASLTAGVRIDLPAIGASEAYKSAYGTRSAFAIPVVFDVAL